jgi:hypothetical protein
VEARSAKIIGDALGLVTGATTRRASWPARCSRATVNQSTGRPRRLPPQRSGISCASIPIAARCSRTFYRWLWSAAHGRYRRSLGFRRSPRRADELILLARYSGHSKRVRPLEIAAGFRRVWLRWNTYKVLAIVFQATRRTPQSWIQLAVMSCSRYNNWGYNGLPI